MMRSTLVLALCLAVVGGCSRDNGKPVAHQPVVVDKPCCDPVEVKVGQAVIIERSVQADCQWRVDQMSDCVEMLMGPTDQQGNQKVKFSFSGTRPGQGEIKLGLHKGNSDKALDTFKLTVIVTKDQQVELAAS